MRIILLFAIAFTGLKVSAQQTIQWGAKTKKINDHTFEVCITANISEGWYIYSHYTPENGPMPTTISYENNASIDTVSKIVEVGKMELKFDSSFGTEVRLFRNKVAFVQLITLKGKLPVMLKCNVDYMGCNAEMCLPPQTENFEIELKP